MTNLCECGKTAFERDGKVYKLCAECFIAAFIEFLEGPEEGEVYRSTGCVDSDGNEVQEFDIILDVIGGFHLVAAWNGERNCWYWAHPQIDIVETGAWVFSGPIAVKPRRRIVIVGSATDKELLARVCRK